MSSLPYRQLRNRRGAVKPLRTRSLPYRQLRNSQVTYSTRPPCSLPYRQIKCEKKARTFVRVCAIYEKKPVPSYELFFKYGGEGGIDSLRSPCGQPTHCVRGLSNWLRQLSNPGRGFSPPWSALCEKKLALSYELFFKYGGEGGIRTPDTLPYTHFPGVLLQPLGHLTKLFCYQTSWVATGRYYRELE